MPTRSLARGSVAAAVLAFAAAIACSGRDRGPGADGEGFKPPVVGAPCTDGQTKACGITLGVDEKGLIDCVQGLQSCEQGAWSTCVATGTKTKALPPPPAAASSPGLGTNDLAGSSSSCVDNPCNPYCSSYTDVPDSAVTTEASVNVVTGESISLADSNTPAGFAKKGSDDNHWCGTGDPIKEWSACQYDQRCASGAACSGNAYAWTDGAGIRRCCAAYTTEKDHCTGVDITAPAVCTPADSSKRALRICNRGSEALTSNIQCYSYPGNAPQFGSDPPNTSPGVGTLVLDTGAVLGSEITTVRPLAAGDCRYYLVPASNFPSAGNASVLCNPPNVASSGGTRTSVEGLPTTVLTSVGWTNPTNALLDTDLAASATTDFGQVTLGANHPSSSSSNSGFTTANVGNAYGSTTSTWADAPLVSTAVTTFPINQVTCTAGSECPSGSCVSNRCTSVSPAPCVGCYYWEAVSNNNGTITSTTFPDALGAREAVAPTTPVTRYARVLLTAASDASTTVERPGVLSPSTTAEVTSITLKVTWWSQNQKINSRVRLLRDDNTEIIGTVPMAPATAAKAEIFRDWAMSTVNEWRDETATMNAPAGLTLAQISRLKLNLYASRFSPGGGAADAMRVDAVEVTIRYRETAAAINYGGFGSFAPVPAGFAIQELKTTAVWRADAVRPGLRLSVQPFGSSGAALGAPFIVAEPAAYVAGSPVTSSQLYPFAVAPAASEFDAPFNFRLGFTSPGTDGDLTPAIDTLEARVIARNGPATRTLWLGGFGFAPPPGSSNFEITAVTSTAVTAPNANSSIQLRTSYDRGATTIRTSAATSPVPTTLTQIADGPFVATPGSSLVDDTFAVGVAASIVGDGTFTNSVDWVRARLSYQTGGLSGHVAECGGALVSGIELGALNNWTSVKANPGTPCNPKTVITVPSWTYPRVFVGTCPKESRPKWRRFGYSSNTPLGTKIEFRFRSFLPDSSGSCVQQTPISTGSPTPLATAQKTTTTDTQTCDLNTTTPTATCPVDLAAGIAGHELCLQMDAYGQPNYTTGDSPALISWRVVYDCVPQE